jgi:hypothetical protein
MEGWYMGTRAMERWSMGGWSMGDKGYGKVEYGRAMLYDLTALDKV